MALLGILKYPDPLLKQVAQPVASVTDETVRLIGDMVETMYAAPGVGLAAPQVGVSKRIIVLDIDHDNPGKGLLKLINPEIRRSEGEVLWEEGCLSVVDFTVEIKRAARVDLKALDEKEKEVSLDAEGLLAVALQHEIDHLNGKLILDRVSRLKRDLYARRLKKMLRGAKPPPENPRVMIEPAASRHRQIPSRSDAYRLHGHAARRRAFTRKAVEFAAPRCRRRDAARTPHGTRSEARVLACAHRRRKARRRRARPRENSRSRLFGCAKRLVARDHRRRRLRSHTAAANPRAGPAWMSQRPLLASSEVPRRRAGCVGGHQWRRQKRCHDHAPRREDGRRADSPSARDRLDRRRDDGVTPGEARAGRGRPPSRDARRHRRRNCCAEDAG